VGAGDASERYSSRLDTGCERCPTTFTGILRAKFFNPRSRSTLNFGSSLRQILLPASDRSAPLRDAD
jgi:hypothetical protein